jgi:hypothetical protein
VDKVSEDESHRICLSGAPSLAGETLPNDSRLSVRFMDVCLLEVSGPLPAPTNGVADPAISSPRAAHMTYRTYAIYRETMVVPLIDWSKCICGSLPIFSKRIYILLTSYAAGDRSLRLCGPIERDGGRAWRSADAALGLWGEHGWSWNDAMRWVDGSMGQQTMK